MSAPDWVWIEEEDVLAIHSAQLRLHGGADGVRDWNMLRSALARPLNAAAYGAPDAASLAAAYAFGIARNHPFIDGNKRTAFVVAATFVEIAGAPIAKDDPAVIAFMLALAAGEMSEDAAADWFRARMA